MIYSHTIEVKAELTLMFHELSALMSLEGIRRKVTEEMLTIGDEDDERAFWMPPLDAIADMQTELLESIERRRKHLWDINADIAAALPEYQ